MTRDVAIARWQRDPGLQAERTALAWNRTGLLVLINAALALRSGWESEETAITFLAIALLAAASAWIIYGAWRRHSLVSRQDRSSPSAVGIAAAAAIALCACVVGVASMI